MTQRGRFTVAFPGEPGAYSEMAALRSGGEPIPCADFRAVFASLRSGEASCAVLPLENSLGGSLYEVWDLLASEPASLVAETYLLVEHRLLGLPGADLESAVAVYSHPQALAQCATFFRYNPHLKAVAAEDTAGAAREVAEAGDPSRLAVASERAGELYGLVELLRPIPASETNVTRFGFMSRLGDPPPAWVPRAGHRKTSLVFGLPHRPGSLVAALGVFNRRGINLTRVESRPMKVRPFEYLFYVDIEGDVAEEPGRAAMAELSAAAVDLKILGSYGLMAPGEVM